MTVHLVRLALELTDDPLQRGYAGMTDHQVADSLNAADRVRYRDVPLGELAGLVELRNIYEKLVAAPADLTAAKLLRLVSGETAISVIEYSLPQVRATLDAQLSALAVASIITGDDLAAIAALGQETVSRAEELGILGQAPKVGAVTVQRARSL